MNMGYRSFIFARSRLLYLLLWAALFVGLSSVPTPATSQGKDITGTVTFVARPPNLDPSAGPVSFVGHAYIIVSVFTNSGPKEDVYGFYPSESGLGVIKGPGMLKAEHRCGPKDRCSPKDELNLLRQYSLSSHSAQVPITNAERKIVYQEMTRWDNKSYTVGSDAKGGARLEVPPGTREFNIANQSCIDFVAAVVTSLGYQTPERSSSQFPYQFLDALEPLVEKEVQERRLKAAENEARAASASAAESARRAEAAEAAAQKAQQDAKAANEAKEESERQRHEAQRRAREAEERAERAENEARQRRERAAREAEARRRQSHPPGWVKCGCAEDHKNHGGIYNGERYHPTVLPCP